MTPAVKLVSIIIVVKNDRGIADTLAHLQSLPGHTKAEVIVVDSSKPKVLADIRRTHPWVKWDQFPYSTARQTPQQRNRGLELARGDVIAFIDANCVPAPTWLEAIITQIQAGHDIVCGPVLDRSPGNLVHYHPDLTQARYVDECTTISVGLSHTVVDRIGGFDNTFLFGQDVDFFWRATDAGFRIYYDPAMAIAHDWGHQKEQLRRAYDYGKARAHLFKKHWHTKKGELLKEAHVWLYPLYIIGLPLTVLFWPYPLLIFIPVLKNRGQSPFGLVLHHLAYGVGVIVGTIKLWPEPDPARLA